MSQKRQDGHAQKSIAELAAKHRLPAVFPGGWGGAEAGGLISYGTTSLNAMRRVPEYCYFGYAKYRAGVVPKVRRNTAMKALVLS